MFSARSPAFALKKAKKIGKEEERIEEYEEEKVFIEFVGIMELKDISIGLEEGEVWYELREMVSPMERKKTIIPVEAELEALRKNLPDRKYQLKYP